MPKKTNENETGQSVFIQEIATETIDVCLLGMSPLIFNRMSQKAQQTILNPSGRQMTRAEKSSNLKHDPISEFRESPYTLREDDAPTFLAGLSAWFKAAMLSTAVRLPQQQKTEIGQVVWVQGDYVPIYGDPQLFMSIVRQAGISRTPDVRTRAIVPFWATRLSIRYVTPLINRQSVSNLLNASGMLAGVGDWRTEKGRGNYGQFRMVSEDDSDYRAVIETSNRASQLKAMQGVTTYDQETDDLLRWFYEDTKRRGQSVTHIEATRRKKVSA